MEKALSHRSWLQAEVLYFVHNFFRPWRIFTDVEFRGERVKASSLESEVGALATVIQKAICDNQGALIEYSYLSGEYHKAMKDAYKAKDYKALAQGIEALMDYLNKALHASVMRNFDSLHSYYALRGSGLGPRVCLKGNYNIRSKDKVVTVFRDGEVDYASNTEIEKNEGHYYIKKTGRFFLQNDIPMAAAEGKYRNPRLDNERAKQFVAGEIQDWRSCWIDQSKDSKSYYMSTLIVPLTLWNNQLSEEFKAMVKNYKDFDRDIFGYLCFDSTERGYFSDTDVKVGYIYADLLSVFMFIRKMYTEISTTYKSASEELKKLEIEVTLEKMGELLTDISVGRFFQKRHGQHIVVATKKNRLVQVDEGLRTFADIDVD